MEHLPISWLKSFGSVPFTEDMLWERRGDYKSLPMKLLRMVKAIESPDGNYLMANWTKALCDTLLIKRNLRVPSPEKMSSPKKLREFLEVDMRFDFEEFGEPDNETLRGFATCGIKPRSFNALEGIFK